MKSTDIKIGEKYQIQYRGCGKVLETRVERDNWSGGSRKDGVKVLFEDGHYAGQEVVVSSRKVVKLWSEHAAEQEIREREARVAKKERERAQLVAQRLEDALEQSGVEVSSCSLPYVGRTPGQNNTVLLRIDEDAAARLTELLGGAEVAERKAELVEPLASGNPLADLLS